MENKNPHVQSAERALTEALRAKAIPIKVARGRLSKQIAHDIGIAEATVKVHRSRAMQIYKSAVPRPKIFFVRPCGLGCEQRNRRSCALDFVAGPTEIELRDLERR